MDVEKWCNASWGFEPVWGVRFAAPGVAVVEESATRVAFGLTY